MRTRHLVAACLIALGACSAVAAPKDTDPVWKLQLRIRVADVTNAGTDADIKVSVNDSNATWVDSMANDFERNSDRLHYLLQKGVPNYGTIKKLSLYHNTTDAICLRSLTLVVNGVDLYFIDYGASGKWLENGTLTITESQLRSNSKWVSYVTPPLSDRMKFTTLENRVEAAWGHMMKGTNCKWADGDVYVLDPDNWQNAPFYISQAQRIPDYNPDGVFRRNIRYPFFTKPVDHTYGVRMVVENKRVKDGAFDEWCTTVFELDMRIVNGRLELTYHDMSAKISATAFEYSVWAWVEFVAAVGKMFTGGIASTAIDWAKNLAYALFATEVFSIAMDNKYVIASFPVKPGATSIVKRKIDGEWWFIFQ